MHVVHQWEITNEWCDTVEFYVNTDRHEAVMTLPQETNYWDSCIIFSESDLIKLRDWCETALNELCHTMSDEEKAQLESSLRIHKDAYEALGEK